MRKPREERTVPAESWPLRLVHIRRSRSGIAELDHRLDGRYLEVHESGVDSDGADYLVIGDDRVLVYVDQLDLTFLNACPGRR